MFASIGPGLGRQRGLAAHRRRRRPSPRSRSGTRRCSRASTSPCWRLLVLLIVRVVSFEWRTQARVTRPGAGSGPGSTWCLAIGAAGVGDRPVEPALRHADRRQPAVHRVVLEPVQPVLGARRRRAWCALCALHGAVYLAMRGGQGDLRGARAGVAFGLAVPAAVLGAVFLSHAGRRHRPQSPARLARVLVVVLGALAVGCRGRVRPGSGSRRSPSCATAATIVLAVVMLFVELYPRVMVSSTSFADSLTVTTPPRATTP